MKKFILLFVIVVAGSQAFAQQKPNIIFHLQSSDTAVYRSVVNQISNTKKDIPDANIEVVCHGPGIEFLLLKNPIYANRLNAMKLKDVNVVGCEYTMAHRNLKKSDLVPFAGTVPSGIVEIIKKQQANWLYVKLGF